MEATREDTGLLNKILPPRLEEAGLEDCALPPDSIQEAFLKAADAVKSRAATLFDASDDKAEGGCVGDPWPAGKGMEMEGAVLGGWTPSLGASDTVVIDGGKRGVVGSCTGVKGGGELAEEEEGRDAVVVAGGEERKSCGDGLNGLGVEGMKENKGKKDDGEEEEEEEKQILVEGVV